MVRGIYLVAVSAQSSTMIHVLYLKHKCITRNNNNKKKTINLQLFDLLKIAIETSFDDDSSMFVLIFMYMIFSTITAQRNNKL